MAKNVTVRDVCMTQIALMRHLLHKSACREGMCSCLHRNSNASLCAGITCHFMRVPCDSSNSAWKWQCVYYSAQQSSLRGLLNAFKVKLVS